MVSEQNARKSRLLSINKKMLSSKFAYFFEYAKEGSHWPYLVLFYVGIGLDPAQAGLISGLRFIGGVLGAPICGWIADKTGIHRTIAMVVCFLAALTNILQPIASMMLGENNKNMCPAREQNVSNVTQFTSFNFAVTYTGASYTEVTSDKTRTFLSLLFISTVASFFDSTTMGFVDSGVLRNIVESVKPTTIGKQRFTGPLGEGVGAFISGLFIDYFPHLSISCYTGIFVNYILACMGMAITFYLLFHGKVNQTNKDSGYKHNINVNKILLANLKRCDTLIFLFIIFFNGIALAFAFSFSFLYLKEQFNVSGMVLGISMAMNGSMGALFFLLSDRLIKLLGGSMKAMAFSCFCWSIRYFLLAYMNHAYQFPLICILNGLTCSLFVSSYVETIKVNFPPIIFTVICGIASSLYNSGAYFLANIIGGICYKMIGPRWLFMSMGFISLCVSFLTLVYAKLLSSKNKTDSGVDAEVNFRDVTVTACSNNYGYTSEDIESPS